MTAFKVWQVIQEAKRGRGFEADFDFVESLK
jgi:hypothetical protein